VNPDPAKDGALAMLLQEIQPKETLPFWGEGFVPCSQTPPFALWGSRVRKHAVEPPKDREPLKTLRGTSLTGYLGWDMDKIAVMWRDPGAIIQ